MTQAELAVLELRNKMAMSILAQNMGAKFNGKLEIWFKDGYVNDIRNTQQFSGISIFDINSLTVYHVNEN